MKRSSFNLKVFVFCLIVSTFNIIAYLKTCNTFCKTVFYPKVDVQLFANKIGNAYKKKTSPNLSSGKNQIKNKFSNSKKGVRPLTTLETKLKEKYADRLFQEVERVHTERIPLNEVKLGDKVRGRIINIEDHGMYVDIGTKKDGLVHIKDVSRDYFIQDLKSRYAPGQDIDVWVKFVDGDKWKLGLQLFPLQPSISSSNGPDPSRERVYINSLVSKSLVGGTVARVSNFGVFVDIGAEVEAFLHRRKMKIVRKRRGEQPWELYPLGSKVSVYIHSVDLAKRRISATTYTPEEWDTMLPNNNVRYDSDFTTDEDEDEELGGSTRAANLRALERTLALSLDGEFEDEFDESMEEEEDDDYDEDDDDVDVIFESGSGSDRAQIVIDDFKDEDRSISSNNAKPNKNKIVSKEEAEEDFSVDDLFIQLAKGKDFVNFNDLKRWGFLESLFESDELDENDLNLMFKEAGGSNRKLTEPQFSEFIEILAQKIDDEEETIETSSPISDSNTNEILMSNKNSVNYLDSDQYLEAKRKAFEEYELDENEFDLNEEINQIDLDEVEVDDEDLIVEEVDEEEVKESFYELTENSKSLSLSKALSWEPIIELISKNVFDQSKFCDLFKEASNGSDDLDFDGFVKLLDLLSPMIEDEDENEDGESLEQEINEDLGAESGTGDNLYLESSIDENNNLQLVSATDDEVLENVFKSLSNGKDRVSFKNLLNWDIVLDLMSESLLNEDVLQEKIELCGGNAQGVDMAGFDKLVDILVGMYADCINEAPTNLLQESELLKLSDDSESIS